MEHFIIILGHTNNKKGQISDIYISRLEKARDILVKNKIKNKNFKILCTGGYGWHFNKTKKPHGEYGKEYLISRGIPEKMFLPIAMSKNTIQDAIYSRKIIDDINKKLIDELNNNIKNRIKIIVVSSDFHMPRVKYIFSKIFDEHYPYNKKYDLEFSEAYLKISRIKLARLKAHERVMFLKMKTTKPISKLYDAAKTVFSRGFRRPKKD